MSTQSLQRVAVRMLYDQDFLDRVYDDAGAATRDCDLTPIERDWLRAPDLRAWRVDPLRRTRSLTALIEEFAVSVALFVRARSNAATRLDSFFSSREFHAGMQRGASLAAVFVEWFGPRVDDQARDLLRLEASLAAMRREFEAGLSSPPFGSLDTAATILLSPAVEILELSQGTVTGFSTVLGELRRGEVTETAMDASVPLSAGASSSTEREGVLVDGRQADPRLEILSADLGRVLVAAVEPIDFPDFARRAAVHGADEEDCRSILSSFAADGIVQVVT
jgi:hypothetical protein